MPPRITRAGLSRSATLRFFTLATVPNTRTALLLLIGTAAAGASLLGAVTTAAFNAQLTSPGNEFSQGTIVLKASSGSWSCYSLAGGVATGSTDTNDFANCPPTLSITTSRPGDTRSALVTLRNDGSLPAVDFRVFSPSACVDADNDEKYHGSGSPCGRLLLSIQQCLDAACATPSACLYGTPSGAACTFGPESPTVASFTRTHGSPSGGVRIEKGLPAGGDAYFKLALSLPDGGPAADNPLMGRKATFGLSWHIAQ